jgi:hypothetical protein
MPEWSLMDGEFDYAAFYWGIVEFFDGGKCTDILNYFDK